MCVCVDSYGHIAPEMKPLWHLGAAAASFIMLKESNESTLYNMAQVANVTQLVSPTSCRATALTWEIEPFGWT